MLNAAMSCHRLLWLHPSLHCLDLSLHCSTGLLFGCTVALLLYGWTPTKCGTGVAAAALEKRSGGCGRSSVVVHLQLDFSAWQCAPLREAERLPSSWSAPPVESRAPSVAVSQPHTSQRWKSDPLSVFWAGFLVKWQQRWVRRSMMGWQRQGGGGTTMLLLMVRFGISIDFNGRAWSTFMDWNGFPRHFCVDREFWCHSTVLMLWEIKV